MSDEIRGMLDRTIEQNKVRERLDRARRDHQVKVAAEAEAANGAARAAAVTRWGECTEAMDNAVQAINERSMQTGILCDQAAWTEDGTLIRRIKFHTGDKSSSPLMFALEATSVLRVESILGVQTFDIATFGPKNVAATANSHFAAILQMS